MARLFTLNRVNKLGFLLNRLNNFSFNSVISKGVSIYCEKLVNRGIIEIRGDDAPIFLQGLITNDINHLTDSSKSSVQLNCIYSMMLNIQGRVLYDVFIYKDIDPSSKKLYLECDNTVIENVIKHLKIYRLRKKIEINTNKEHQVWSVFNDSTNSSDYLLKGETHKFVINKDPRTKTMGWRILAHKETNVSHKLEIQEVKEKYRGKLYEEGIGEGIEDHPPGNCFPLECNADYLNGVSFFKGCYIGQELTSRVHHTGVVRKRIMPFKISEGTIEDLKKAEIFNEEEKKVGKPRGSFDTFGIGLLRINEVLSSKELYLKNENSEVKILVNKPSWWPLEVKK